METDKHVQVQSGSRSERPLVGQEAFSCGAVTAVANSSRLSCCLKMAIAAAKTSRNIVIYGETGTGKNLFARAIHEHFSHLKNRFIRIDCRVPDEALIEAILLVAGKSRSGINPRPPWGTVYLDEIGDLSLENQKRIFALLQAGLSHQREDGSPIRLIAASQLNLVTVVKQGRFRNDLFTFLQNIQIDLPPLRERAEEILQLSRYFLSRLCLLHGLPQKVTTPEVNGILLRYPWPGNVRELANTLEQSLLSARYEKTLFPKHLPNRIRIQVARATMVQ